MMQDVSADLLRFVTPDETAAQFLLRQSVEAVPTGLPFIDAHITLRPGVCLELVGPAGSSKSEILIQVALNALCSSDTAPGEGAGHVVVVDCGGNFDLLRLIQVLKARSEAGSRQLDLHNLLQHLHVVRCFSSLELLMALATLPSRLSGIQGCCKMLLLDNVAAFMWQDRAAAAGSGSAVAAFNQPHHDHHQQQPQQQQQQQQQYRQPGPGLDASRAQGAVAALLRGLSQQLRCPVIVTKQAVVVKVEQQGGLRLQQNEVLTSEWQSVVSCRLLLLPVLSAGTALQALAAGQQGTQLLLQWQACKRLDIGPLEQHEVLPTGGLMRSAAG